jgi:hypothetical protein
MHVVYEAENLIDAHLVRGLLQGEGIEVFIRGEHLIGAMGELPVAGLIAVCVPEQQLPRARALLDEWAEQADPAEEPDPAPLAPRNFVA